jgi:ubiquinone/menaquinone biosynthesis C-methylase UbiE
MTPTTIREHYQQLFKDNGPGPQAVQYSSRESQWKRFEVLCQISNSMNSVLDVGCGLGDLFQFFIEKEKVCTYLGVDFVDEFIHHAKERFKERSQASFRRFDARKEHLPKDFDYAILSGVFNNKTDDNASFMKRVIRDMYEAAKCGVAFNAMSTYVDYRDENLYYSDPRQIFDYCKSKLTKRIVLRHDYCVKTDSIPFEYTIYLYK